MRRGVGPMERGQFKEDVLLRRWAICHDLLEGRRMQGRGYADDFLCLQEFKEKKGSMRVCWQILPLGLALYISALSYL